MKIKVFLLELVEFYYFDEKDGEDVEDRWIIGYYSRLSRLQEDLIKCITYKKNNEKVVITPYEVDLKCNQNYVYILSYEYSYKINDNYIDYSYVFEPQSSKKKCIELMSIMKEQKKYSHNDNKIYDDRSKLGYFLDKYELNVCYYSLEPYE